MDSREAHRCSSEIRWPMSRDLPVEVTEQSDRLATEERNSIWGPERN